MLWIVVSLLVNNPCLVEAVVALVPVNMSSVCIGVSMDIKASVSNISDVSSLTFEPSDLLKERSSVLSCNSSIVVVSPILSSKLDGNNMFHVGSSSNGFCSPVEDEPLVVVVWVIVLDSESILV